MKTCHFCGNKNFIDKNVQYTYKLNNKFLMVDDVPCHQCEYCGEQYFAGKILKQIEQEFDAIHYHGKKVSRKVVIPTEQFAEIQSSNTA